jgi:hypothetical protein
MVDQPNKMDGHMLGTEDKIKQDFDERKLIQETADKKRELDLRQREVEANELEAKRPVWESPTVIGIIAAFLGVIGSFVVAGINNSNAQQVEKFRAQSNLILEVLKSGNRDTACKDLVFFVRLHRLDDPDRVIQDQCADAFKAAPPLPSSFAPQSSQRRFSYRVVDAEYGTPIAGVKMSIKGQGINASVLTDQGGSANYDVPMPGQYAITLEKDGYEFMGGMRTAIPTASRTYHNPI